jgi:ribose 5-phosphate isomerase B
MHLIFASDHAGVHLKSLLIQWAKEQKYTTQDLGPADPATSVDYPDFAVQLAKALEGAPSDQTRGVLICGSGMGMAIAANRFSHIRCTVCRTPEEADLARAHNDANVLALGSRLMSSEQAIGSLETFLKTPFEGGRHENRVAKLSHIC